MSESKTKQTKPRYELKPRDQRGYYALLCEGEHNLCAICTKTTRGLLDAQLLLLAMNSHEDLLAACEELYALADDGSASFDDPEPDSLFLRAKAAIENAKSK